MRMPWRRAAALEGRIAELEAEQRNYSDAITQAIINASADAAANGYVAALEVASGQLSRAFASAGVGGAGAAMFTPDVLAQIGRALVENGEAVWYRIGRRLARGDQYDISGDSYVFSPLSGSGSERRVPASRVLHVRWNVEVSTGRGLSPLGAARTLRELMQKLESSIEEEAGAAVGYLLPVPADGDAGNIDQLKADLAALKGRIAVVETTRGGWTGDPSGAPARDFALSRMGANFPTGNVQLYTAAHNTVLAACGYPVQLATDSDGTAQREAWRRYLHGTVAPLGRLLANAAAMAGAVITLDFDDLFASDISGRARAFQSLVNGGMDAGEAAALSGLISEDD